MKSTYLILFLSLFILGCAKQSQNHVEQIVVMLGSDEFDFDQAVIMKKMSEGVGFGVGGEEWGGEVAILVDGTEMSVSDWGGITHSCDPKSETIELKGEATTELYFGVIYQVFYNWPDDVDGVIMYKEKIDAGDVHLKLDLSALSAEAQYILLKQD